MAFVAAFNWAGHEDPSPYALLVERGMQRPKLRARCSRDPFAAASSSRAQDTVNNTSWLLSLSAVTGVIVGRHAFLRSAGRRPLRTRVRTSSDPCLDGVPSRKRPFQWAKWRTFWACFFGYAVFYFTRQSLSYTAPVLKQAMGWEGLSQLGQLSSLFPLAYGSSRFLGGVLADRMSPRKVFALGLAICGALNVAFGLSSTLPVLATIWCLNGCFQGLGASPSVKLVNNWFDADERGFWWSIWHASINLGGFLIPFISGGLAETLGWRYGMLGPGCLALATSVLCLMLMRDGPPKTLSNTKQAAISEGAAMRDIDTESVSITEGLLVNPVQWAMAASYMGTYVLKNGLGVWGIFYLLHTGTPNAAKAAALFSGFEAGGFLGNLSCGTLSDYLMRRAGPDESGPGQRVKVVCGCFVATLLLLSMLARCPGSTPTLQYVLLFGIGHFVAGAQLLLSLAAAEAAPKNLVVTTIGFIGWVGYFGAASAGLPLAWVVQNLGWDTYFSVLVSTAGLGVVLLLPLRGLRSWEQRRSGREFRK